MNNKKVYVINSSKEMEYSICSYLMINQILKAYICSKSESIIDRLGEYMTYCGIPSTFQNSNKNLSIGYILGYDEDISIPGLLKIIIKYGEVEEETTQEDALIMRMESSVYDQVAEYIDLDTVPVHLQNGEIRKMFLYAFKIADTEIDIISPWMNAAVVNDELINMMEKALDRGVKIRIIYGLNDGMQGDNYFRNTRSNYIADRLRRVFHNRGNQFVIKKDNIHYKLVLCDEKYKLEGGFNYLSFIGNYDSPGVRTEGSPFGRDVNEIRILRERYFEEL